MMRDIRFTTMVRVDGVPTTATGFLCLDYGARWRVKPGHTIHITKDGAELRPIEETDDGER